MSFVASYLALWLLVTCLMLVAIGLLREITILRRSLAGVAVSEAPVVIGSRAPKFSAMDGRSGRTVTSEIIRKRSSLIVFISPQCPICRQLIHSFGATSRVDVASTIFVCKGTKDECSDLARKVSSEIPVLCDPQGEVSEIYGVSNYPVAVVVDSRGRLGAYGYPRNRRDLEELAVQGLRDMSARSSSASGSAIAESSGERKG